MKLLIQKVQKVERLLRTTKIKLIRTLPLGSLDKWLLALYLLKTYGSLILNSYGIISDITWERIVFTSNQLMLLGFARLLKGHISNLMYKVLIALFLGRFISQLVCDGFEFRFEMPLILTLTVITFILDEYKKRKS